MNANNVVFQDACCDGNIEKVKFLWDNVDRYDNYNLAFRMAIQNGHIEIVKLFLSDPQFNARYLESFVFDLARNNLEMVKLFLADQRFDPTGNGYNYAIRASAEKGRIDIVSVLLADPRVNPKGEEGIYIQVIAGYPGYIEIAVIDNVICHVINSDVSSIEDDGIREKFVKWQYRIGGEKWAKAINLLI